MLNTPQIAGLNLSEGVVLFENRLPTSLDASSELLVGISELSVALNEDVDSTSSLVVKAGLRRSIPITHSFPFT